MTKTKSRKLNLKKETLKSLDSLALQQVGGGTDPLPFLTRLGGIFRITNSWSPFECN